MKKQYIQPSMKAYEVKANDILAGSGGVGNGGSLGNSYSQDDASYGKRNRGPLDWDED